MKYATTVRKTKFTTELGPVPPTISSQGLDWHGFAVHTFYSELREIPERIDERYILGLWNGNILRGEHRRGLGAFVPFTRLPGTITTLPPGLIPETHPYGSFSVTLCLLDSSFVDGVEQELDPRPAHKPHFHPGIEDAPLRQLMTLLMTEARQRGDLGRLYAEHLAHALVTRLYFAQFGDQNISGSAETPLPGHLLRRVVDRMHDLNSDLSLPALAAETGYSRAHFARMFRRATGHTPHQYVLQLRVARAQELLRKPHASLIDIATICGFSSHAHMSRIFRQVVGASPGAYRRSI
jgi:AraC family transcriptional regulator